MMQKSTYSVYNTVPWYQMALEASQARCSLQVPTEVPPPLIVVPTPEPFCMSGNYYTTHPGWGYLQLHRPGKRRLVGQCLLCCHGCWSRPRLQ